MTHAIGIDVGGTIIDKYKKTFFTDKYLETEPERNAFAALGQLWELFDGNLWIVSKAKPESQKKVTAWMWRHKFEEETGIPINERVVFVDKYEDKVQIAADYGLDFFVDDRVEAIIPMIGYVPNLILLNAHHTKWNDNKAILEDEVQREYQWPTAFKYIRAKLYGMGNQEIVASAKAGT